MPSLLASAGTWVAITPRLVEMLEEMQELFWRTVLQVPKGTPKVMLRAETGCIKMKFRIWKLKMMLARRIRSQEGSLAKAIYVEQEAMGWPGLAAEVKEIGKAVGVKDDDEKTGIEEAIFYANQREMKEDMKKYEKLEKVKNEDFRKEQEYLSWKGMDRGRLAFRIRSKMVKNVKKNFRNMYCDVKCEHCDLREEESQEHMMVCPGWVEEMATLDVIELKDQVKFFSRVMKRKIK